MEVLKMLPASSLFKTQSVVTARGSRTSSSRIQRRVAVMGGVTCSSSKQLLNCSKRCLLVANHSSLPWISSPGIIPSKSKNNSFIVRNGALADAQRSEADSQEKLQARIQELKSETASTIDEVESGVREGQFSDHETAMEAQALGESLGEAKSEVLNVEQAEIDKECGKDAEEQDREISTDDGDDMEDIEVEKGYKMSRVCDRLIEVFMVEKTKPEEWRILLAFSQEWVKIRLYFFKRCKTLAAAEEDPKRKADLLKLARRMKKVDDDMQQHDQLLAVIEENPSEMDRIVAHRRQDFTGDFFKHLNILCDACYENLDRRDELASVAAQCLASVQAYDTAVADDEKLSVAQLKFDDILSSPSLEAAAKKIDNLAKKRELDPTLMLLITKAWAAAKESTMMKEEVKDIMFHLYNVARGNMSRLVPKEVRIIRHLLAIEDPRERISEMTNAFSPGDELEGKDFDNLYTTPDKLHRWLTIVLEAFHSNKKGTLIKEAQNLMNPSVIGRIEALKGVLEDHFM
ncbi:hypothetical protein CY35_18G026200 [Sphagnum magellanicum]|nr:hypothetical protein CY35_18G026200 [Sphagnum magellanicum]